MAISLNHCYVVLGEKLFNALAQSDFLRNEFGNCEIKTNTTNLGSWTGMYLRGETTYLELFGSLPPQKVGSIGIAYGVDQQGSLKNFQNKLSSDFELTYGSFKKAEHKNNLFDYLQFSDGGITTKLETWIMEYLPDGIKEHEASNPTNFAAHDVSRKRYNHHAVDRTKLFKDIVELRLALNNNEFARISNELSHLGCSHEGNEKKKRYVGKDITFNLIHSTKAPRIEIVCELFRAVEKAQTYSYDHATITLEGTQAIISLPVPSEQA